MSVERVPDQVQLAPEGTPLAAFQRERTAAISEMFDDADDVTGLYPTGRFFARLDACVTRLLADTERAALDRAAQAIKEKWANAPRWYIYAEVADYVRALAAAPTTEDRT